MIKTYQKLRIPDETKQNDLLLEVNWNPHDETVKDCKLIRVTHPGGKSSVIKREHLHAFLFSISTPDQQKKLIPTVQSTTRHYETVVSVQAKEDIKKGETITFPLKLTLPTLDEEVLNDARQQTAKGLTKP